MQLDCLDSSLLATLNKNNFTYTNNNLFVRKYFKCKG